MELRIEGSTDTAELQPGVVIREQHRFGQERTVHAVSTIYVECVGVASGRRTFVRAATVAKRYKIVRRGA